MTISFAYYELSCASGYFDQDVLDRTTEWVMGICDGQDSCRSGLCTLIQKYGDPYPGCRKDFYVKAEYFKGVRISDQVMPEAGNRDKIFLFTVSTRWRHLPNFVHAFYVHGFQQSTQQMMSTIITVM